jgi:DNA-binding Xre family transcriptional regulator
MRKLNAPKLKEYLAIQGKLSKETLAVETGISFFKLERMINGKREATKPEMMALCKATEMDEEDLFPTVISKEKTAV